MVNWDKVLDTIDDAKTFFESESIKPTLRTLFYYLVSKEVIPNTVSSYKRLSRVLVKARKEERYAWDFLEDNARTVIGELDDVKFNDNADGHFKSRVENQLKDLDIDKMIDETFDYLMPSTHVGTWANQPIIPEIWIEKEALASTVAQWIGDWHLPIRVNKGYSSWTFIYNNIENLKEVLATHDKIMIFYLGDLDPSGVDMDRFLQEAFDYFELDPEQVEFTRLALTPDHVEKFGLPPMPKDAETLAKLRRDPRTATYTGGYVVELDALVAYAPKQFRQIIEDALNEKWDRSIKEELDDEANEMYDKLEEILEDIKERAKEKILKELK